MPKKKKPNPFECMDCHKDTGASGEYYMLIDALWQSIVPDKQGMLCIECVEKRLGRRLRSLDFSPAPLNLIEAQQNPIILNRLLDIGPAPTQAQSDNCADCGEATDRPMQWMGTSSRCPGCHVSRLLPAPLAEQIKNNHALMKDAFWPRRYMKKNCPKCNIDLEKHYEIFELQEATQDQVGYLPDGQLCVTCTEKKLGRKLVPADFTRNPINILYARRNPALAERMLDI